MNSYNKSDFESTDSYTSLSPEDIAYDSAYNHAFSTLFPLLHRFESLLPPDGKALLNELLKNFAAVLEEQVRRSYRTGLSDGEKSE